MATHQGIREQLAHLAHLRPPLRSRALTSAEDDPVHRMLRARRQRTHGWRPARTCSRGDGVDATHAALHREAASLGEYTHYVEVTPPKLPALAALITLSLVKPTDGGRHLRARRENKNTITESKQPEQICTEPETT